MSTPNLSGRVVYRFLTAQHAVGDTEERGTLRIHRFRDSLRLWDLTNAGKRGKKVDLYAISARFGAENELYDLTDLLEKADSFDKAVSIVNDFLKELDQKGTTATFDTHAWSERGVDVMPGGFKKLEVNGKKVYIMAEYKSFSVRDKEDLFNEPSCIPAIKGGLKSIPVFYRWVQDNAEAIMTMSFREVLDAMQKNGVDYHYYCAVD